MNNSSAGNTCIPPVSYNGAARLELPGTSIEIPATVSENKVLPYGLTKSFSRDESIEIGKIPLQIPNVLGLKTVKNARIVDYDILYSN